MAFALVPEWEEFARSAARYGRRSCIVPSAVPDTVLIIISKTGTSCSAAEHSELRQSCDAGFSRPDECIEGGNGSLEEERSERYHAGKR
ncbi:hypothetical protein D3C77_579820 [compost metagenome]